VSCRDDFIDLRISLISCSSLSCWSSHLPYQSKCEPASANQPSAPEGVRFRFSLLVGGSLLTRETVAEQFSVQRLARTITRSFAHEVIAAKFFYLDSEGELGRLGKNIKRVSCHITCHQVSLPLRDSRGGKEYSGSVGEK
jgi:hypothetical protein